MNNTTYTTFLELIKNLIKLEEKYPHIILCKNHCCTKFYEFKLITVFKELHTTLESLNENE